MGSVLVLTLIKPPNLGAKPAKTHGGTIVGLIIGLIIILVGVTSLAGIDLEFWPLIIVIFGLLISGGAIYTLTRKR